VTSPIAPGHVLVIGSAGLDIVGRPRESLQPGSSSPGILRSSFGGVGRNVAENLARLGTDVVFVTAVGDDDEGQRLLVQVTAVGVDTRHSLRVPAQATGAYLAVLDEHGRLHLALDDMHVVENITPDFVRECKDLFRGAMAVFLDANLPPRALAAAAALARRFDVPVAADPTSVGLAPRLVPLLADVWLLTCNEAEVLALCPASGPGAMGEAERAIELPRRLISKGVDIAIVAMAEAGVGYATAEINGHIPALQVEVVDPTGAGDALSAAVMFGLLNDIPLDEAVRLGVSAAAVTLRTRGSVAPGLSLELLYEQLR
jgi:pseudouridine kinase